MKLYHGTSFTLFTKICKHGAIAPRRVTQEPSQWTLKSHPDFVLLTVAYAHHYALNAARGTDGDDEDDLIIIEFELDETQLYPDEDFLEQASRGDPIRGATTMKERTLWYRNRLLDYQEYGLASLEHLGNASWYGSVPTECWTRGIRISTHRFAWLFDPTITLINYRLLGGYYRASLPWLFGDEVDYDSDPLGYLKNLSRAEPMRAEFVCPIDWTTLA